MLVVRGAHAGQLPVDAPLRRVKPARGELVALQTPRSYGEPVRFAVRPLTLPRYGGDPGAQLLLYSVKLERYLEAKHPGLIDPQRGPHAHQPTAGYQITWQTKIKGRTTFGRDVMVVDDVNAARIGATLEMLERHLAARPERRLARRDQPAEVVAALVPAGTERP